MEVKHPSRGAVAEITVAGYSRVGGGGTTLRFPVVLVTEDVTLSVTLPQLIRNMKKKFASLEFLTSSFL